MAEYLFEKYKVNLDILKQQIEYNLENLDYIIFNSPNELKIIFTSNLSSEDQDILNGIVDDHPPKTGQKNFNVKEFSENNFLLKDIWYNTEINPDEYVDKVEEIIYNYEDNKLISQTIIKYYLGDIEYYNETYEYWTDPDTKKVILKKNLEI